MLSLKANCENCRNSIDDGDEIFCEGCWKDLLKKIEEKEKELMEMDRRIEELEAKIESLKKQLFEMEMDGPKG